MSTLVQLFDYLDGLRRRPVLAELAEKLEQLDLAGTLEELTPKLKFSERWLSADPAPRKPALPRLGHVLEERPALADT
jgi:hypothetical protein